MTVRERIAACAMGGLLAAIPTIWLLLFFDAVLP